MIRVYELSKGYHIEKPFDLDNRTHQAFKAIMDICKDYGVYLDSHDEITVTKGTFEKGVDAIDDGDGNLTIEYRE